ncbi:hypothetical protein SAY86_015049 [Trapa natans]|uniref:Glycosyltransferase n=1 Tax=Trapa natans TaxID=22666 RepID=A0AAN7QGW5_TRANT|nr:hypothetical protein SAY86_015049 [Trapa natans]
METAPAAPIRASDRLHFVLIPLMAQGHMIPIFDIARILGRRRITTTIYTTPMNATRFRLTMSRNSDLGLPVRLVEVPFASDEVGLPYGCENLDALPSPDLLRKFHCALEKMQAPVEAHLRDQGPPPSCIISDLAVFWTVEIARKFNVPRLIFNGMSCFSRLVCSNVEEHLRRAPEYYSSLADSEQFEVPGMPIGFKLRKSQLPKIFGMLPNLGDFRAKVDEAEKTAQGLIINSFDELEDGCVSLYEKAIGQRIWCIGPVLMCNKTRVDRLNRGNKVASDEADRCIEWLDGMGPGTVVYACLGSLCRLVPAQLMELGKGLEASNRPFIWVVKTAENERTWELEKLLKDYNFEERTRGRGFLIRGWAPQLAILSHRSIGAFLTHCGWNSTLEGLCSGLPMITWPLFAEQFVNEAMVVDVLRVGVRVGVETAVKFGQEAKLGVLVKEGEVLRAIEEVMSSGEKGEERRKRAVELAEKGRTAAEEGGGSSYSNLTHLIQFIICELESRSKM